MNAAVQILLSLVVLVSVWIGDAAGQLAPPQVQGSDPPPITMIGWQYEKGPNGLHAFLCRPPVCRSFSTVSYQLLSPELQMTFEYYRQRAEPRTRDMENSSFHGMNYKLLGVEDASKKVGGICVACSKRIASLLPRAIRKKDTRPTAIFLARATP